MRIYTIFLFVLIFFKYSKTQNYDTRPTVHIIQGTIIGIKIYLDDSVAINAYLGIPYAEPPIGNLRFAVPQQQQGWNGTLYAANYRPICPFQTISTNEREDCLYLNIWTPVNGNTFKLPVIVIMESEQAISQSNLVRIPGDDLAREGAVVVSVSYRQNIFGFFCLGNSEARGNLGLLDQYLALVWVKENIFKFGGNPQLVTIMGYSSSAATILYQIISPRTTGLFNSAILMSGSETKYWHTEDVIKISNKLTNDIGCLMSTTSMSLNCLRTKSVEEILRYFHRQSMNNILYNVMPVHDTFLPEKHRYLPLELQSMLEAGNFTSIPILSGITDFLSNAEQWKWNDLNQDYVQLMQYAEKSVIPTIIQQYSFNETNKEIVKEIIRWKYLWIPEKNAAALADRIHKLQWDARVAAPYDRQLNLLIKSPTTVFTYCLHQFSTLANVSTLSTISGDLLILFGPALLHQVARRQLNVAETTLSKRMKQLWITFAIQGNPIRNGYRDMWQPYQQTNKFIKYFGNRQWDSQQYENTVLLWNNLLPKIAAVTNTMNTIPKELQYSPDPAAGFRHAMYTLVGLVIALLALLLVCVVLLKKRAKESMRQMGFS